VFAGFAAVTVLCCIVPECAEDCIVFPKFFTQAHMASSQAKAIIGLPQLHKTHIYHFKEIIGCENLGDRG